MLVQFHCHTTFYGLLGQDDVHTTTAHTPPPPPTPTLPPPPPTHTFTHYTFITCHLHCICAPSPLACPTTPPHTLPCPHTLCCLHTRMPAAFTFPLALAFFPTHTLPYLLTPSLPATTALLRSFFPSYAFYICVFFCFWFLYAYMYGILVLQFICNFVRTLQVGWMVSAWQWRVPCACFLGGDPGDILYIRPISPVSPLSMKMMSVSISILYGSTPVSNYASVGGTFYKASLLLLPTLPSHFWGTYHTCFHLNICLGGQEKRKRQGAGCVW